MSNKLILNKGCFNSHQELVEVLGILAVRAHRSMLHCRRGSVAKNRPDLPVSLPFSAKFLAVFFT